MEEIKEITKDLVGKEVTCYLNDTFIDSAKIQWWNGGYYICQNLKNGAICKDKLGYKYSWMYCIGGSTTKIFLKDSTEVINKELTNKELIIPFIFDME